MINNYIECVESELMFQMKPCASIFLAVIVGKLANLHKCYIFSMNAIGIINFHMCILIRLHIVDTNIIAC